MSSVIVHMDIDQNSEAWAKLRCGRPTASCFSQILAKGEGKTRKSYLNRLAAEIITGEPLETYRNEYMDRGHEQEDEARRLYAFATNTEPERVGFIENGPYGCSPDSLIGDRGGLEIKTQRADLLIDTMGRDDFPPEHRAQVQGTIWLSERDWWDIIVYAPGMPRFIKRAYRDDSYIANLSSEVARFYDELQATVERIRRYGLSPAERTAELAEKLRRSA